MIKLERPRVGDDSRAFGASGLRLSPKPLSPRCNWHIISLNIECKSAAFNNDCSTTDGGLLSQETQWLSADLAGNHRACTIAYWHQPAFTAADTSADVPDPSAPGADSVEGLAER